MAACGDGVGDRIYRAGRPPTRSAESTAAASATCRSTCPTSTSSDLDAADPHPRRAGVGDVDVIVPRDADVQVNIDPGIGDVEVFDEEGRERRLLRRPRVAAPGSDDGEPEIVLTINAGIGDVEVSRG